MPANLSPDYRRAEERLRAARTVEDKIAALEEMLRVIPKHKGTDALQGDLKSRIAKLRKAPPARGARAAAMHLIPSEGAGQVALVGLPNTGKSALVASLTHATPEVADYAFTTRTPTPGMMRFEDVSFQLIDLPPLSTQHVEPWVFDLIRHADLLWIVVDGADPLGELDEATRLLEDKHIAIHAPGVAIPKPDGSGWTHQRAILVAAGADRPGAEGDIAALDALLEGAWHPVAVSSVSGEGLDALRKKTFEAFEILRVYTKQPGKPADREAPFTLPIGATVHDLAVRIHKELAATFRYARIWGSSAFDGQSVQGEHVLAEGDVVELHG